MQDGRMRRISCVCGRCTMDAPLLAPLLTAVAILVCGVLLALVCVDCLRNGTLVSIQEENATDEYIPSNEFRLVRPHLLTTGVTSDLLLPLARSSNPGSHHARRSVTTQSESNASYENSPEGLDDPQCFAEDYIIVLPEDQDALTNQTAASTPSSGVPHEYVNVLADDREYLNVMPPPSGETSTSSQSDEDDEGEGNYVNQPSVMSQPVA
ncbi:uncharacterized protein LOC129171242 [Dunckerocampus dactyliophorus]|uniref:uncharacterized protein LOC129171242 n=1 Tax=Dunckerocampus dactyliophorus TaxID=161453 RepID=UPI0024059D1C|nr:uncharacterized protein LOC129171242 [Dunckerocampus dactyliophorus]XP_054615677.1 uncharacterized protein LOC129171242 [Dunckerocampus dactyliophorus]